MRTVFLVNPDDWSNDIVAYFAKEEDVSELTEKPLEGDQLSPGLF